MRIVGSEATTYLYMGDQWDLNSIWDARYLWVPMNIDDDEGDLSLAWHDVYDLNVSVFPGVKLVACEIIERHIDADCFEETVTPAS